MEITNQFSWMIGGPQGTGVDSSATLFIRSCAVAGLNVFGKREYHSNIMGEHSYFQVRVSENEVYSHIDPVHLLATFDDETARTHAHEVAPGGYFFYDANVTKPETLELDPSVKILALPYSQILEEVAAQTGQHLAKLQIMKNTIAVGASLALTGFDKAYIEKALKGLFTGKKAKLVDLNMQVANKAYDFIAANVTETFPYRLKAIENAPPRMIMNGTTAVALGKLKAGCKFQSYYPITPASDESVYLEGKGEYGINVVQCEDEIAAACMAVGAALTGVRSSTSSSGPGFGLKAEGIGWAGINEVPVVVFNYQRGGPSTGLPTRHEQGDLLFSMFICHGEFPRIVMSPGDMTECFHSTFNAFNYAEEFQTPVIMLVDKALANNTNTVPAYDESQLRINRGKRVTDEELKAYSESPEYRGQYPRFAESADGVSPRPIPGQQYGLFWNTGDEHDEWGHIAEDTPTRLWMHEKRFRKMKLIADSIPQDEQYRLYGPEDADITVVTWGSSKGPVLDAMPILKSDGITVNCLQIKLLNPFPAEAVKKILERAKLRVGVEMNFTGQLARLVRMETGIAMDNMIVKYQGRPMSESEVVSGLREIAKQQTERVVLVNGH